MLLCGLALYCRLSLLDSLVYRLQIEFTTEYSTWNRLVDRHLITGWLKSISNAACHQTSQISLTGLSDEEIRSKFSPVVFAWRIALMEFKIPKWSLSIWTPNSELPSQRPNFKITQNYLWSSLIGQIPSFWTYEFRKNQKAANLTDFF